MCPPPSSLFRTCEAAERVTPRARPFISLSKDAYVTLARAFALLFVRRVSAPSSVLLVVGDP